MKVLVVTGDRSFRAGHPRFDMQAGAVERLEVVYWGPSMKRLRVPKETYDVVTVQDPFWRGFLAWRVAREMNAHLNIQLHADFNAQSWVKKMVGRFVLRQANSIRVVSEQLKKQVEALGVTAPITILPIFIDIERFRQVQRTPDATPLLLWVGRFEDEKDPLSALKIFKSVQEHVPDAKLVMLGGGSLEKKLKEAAHNLPIEFPGWQDPVPYLARATAVLSTSRTESWGASIIEALAAGVPVVAPDVGVACVAGAIVVPREKLAGVVTEILASRVRGELKINTLDQSEWIQIWKSSLM